MRILILSVALLTGCAATQEQRTQWQDTKLENNAAHYQSCKRQLCELSYTQTVRLFEGGDLSGWQAFCE